MLHTVPGVGDTVMSKIKIPSSRRLYPVRGNEPVHV